MQTPANASLLSIKVAPEHFPVPLFIWLNVTLFGYWIHASHPAISGAIDWASVVSEGLVTLMPATGLFLVTGLRAIGRIYWPLQISQAMLFTSFLTDVLDEFVDMPDGVNHLFEGTFQVLGFALFTFALTRWVRYSTEINQHLHALATTDPLTGLSNRRHFLSELQREAARASRYNSPLSLILFDIDHFKSVNDLHGHDVGDIVLKELSTLAQTQIRQIDLVARYGGEEFVLFAPLSDLEQARQLAEKIRHRLREHPMPGVGQVTASFGVTQYWPGEELESTLKRADVALYQAKSEGRDRVVSVHRRG